MVKILFKIYFQQNEQQSKLPPQDPVPLYPTAWSQKCQLTTSPLHPLSIISLYHTPFPWQCNNLKQLKNIQLKKLKSFKIH